jgi:hypothetical protein
VLHIELRKNNNVYVQVAHISVNISWLFELAITSKFEHFKAICRGLTELWDLGWMCKISFRKMFANSTKAKTFLGHCNVHFTTQLTDFGATICYSQRVLWAPIIASDWPILCFRSISEFTLPTRKMVRRTLRSPHNDINFDYKRTFRCALKLSNSLYVIF